MDERRRFQIALGGIASCLLIAALFVSSAPPLSHPVVPRVVLSTPLPLAFELTPPNPADLLADSQASAHSRPAPRTSRAPLRNRAVAPVVAVHHVTTSPVVVEQIEAAPLRPRSPQVVLTSVPAARGVSVAMPTGDAEATSEASNDRSPVTGAFVTVGREVGHGFRTAGRAIKSIF